MLALNKIKRGEQTNQIPDSTFEVPAAVVKKTAKRVETDAVEDARPELETGGGQNALETAKTKLKGLHLPIKRGIEENDGHAGKKAAMLALAAGSTGLGIMGSQGSALAAEVGRMDLRAAQANQIDHASSSTAMYVSSASDIVRNFTLDRHVYVVGQNLQTGGAVIPSAQLDELERWFDQNAPNAYVTIFQNGNSSGGWEEVKRTVGDGLSASPGFSEIKDARTGQRDSLVMAISLDDKKHTIKAGEALDYRRLGEANYVNNLDAPFKAAMKGGDGLVVAIQNTIQNINRRYDASVREEITARENQLNQAKQSLTGAGGSIALLEQKLQSFRDAHRGMTGDLTRPELGQMRTELAAAENALAGGDTTQATRLSQAVASRAEAHIRALHNFERAPQQFNQLQQKIDEAAKHPYADAGANSLDEARRELELARAEHGLGNASYSTHYEAANKAQAHGLAAANSEQAVVVGTRVILGGGAIVGLFALLALGQIKHKKASAKGKEAKELLETWQKALNDKTTVLMGLLEKAQLAFGRGDDEMAKRLEGKTLALAQEMINDIDNCLVQLGAAHHVLGRAEAKIEAPIRNFFSTQNYEAAIALLRDEPIKWDPDQGSSARALVALIKGVPTDREILTGGIDGLQSFAWSFEQLMNNAEKGKEGFNIRSGRAYDALGVLENARVEQASTMQMLEQHRQIAVGALAYLAHEGEKDKLFTVPSVGTKMLAAAAEAEKEARAQAQKDPLGAQLGPWSDAIRLVRDAVAITGVMSDARREVLPLVDGAIAKLEAQGLDATWLDAAKRKISARGEELAVIGCDRPIDDEATEIDRENGALMKTARRASELAELRGTVQKDIDAGAELIAKTREELAKGTAKRPDEMLREKDRDPSAVLKSAQEQHRASKAAFDRGDIEAAAHALDAAQALVRNAASIVEQSKAAKVGFAKALAVGNAGIDGVAGRVAGSDEKLAGIRKTYAPSVMALGAGDAAHPNANGTIADNVEEASAAILDARRVAGEAERAFGAGKYLEAKGLLDQMRGLEELASHRLQEIAEKETRLASTQRENGKTLAGLGVRLRELEQYAEDPRSMKPTIELVATAKKELAAAKAAVEAAKNDPFEACALLAKATATFDRATTAFANDKDIYAEADRSLRAAETALASAKRLVVQSANDGVTDSGAITRANAEVAQLERALEKAKPALGEKHGDWNALDKEADRLTAAFSTQAATLRNELEEAQSAISAITTGSSAVRSASGWSGSYGVSISGSPGSSDLDSARSALDRGDYASALSYAQRAKREADSAVSDAESEVRSRRRDEEERIAAEARRRREEEEERQRRASESSYSSSSSGGFGSSSDYSSSSSGGFGSDSSW